VASVQMKEGPAPARWQRSLLPGSMVDGPGADRSLRDWAVDALVTVVALGIGIAALLIRDASPPGARVGGA
jgi:hypothetical protein